MWGDLGAQEGASAAAGAIDGLTEAVAPFAGQDLAQDPGAFGSARGFLEA
jgi:hypothetical protein